MSNLDTNRFLLRAQKVFLYIGIVYVGGLTLLTLPWFQAQCVSRSGWREAQLIRLHPGPSTCTMYIGRYLPNLMLLTTTVWHVCHVGATTP